jgi:uncharacterized protein (TIRG00374 family)
MSPSNPSMASLPPPPKGDSSGARGPEPTRDSSGARGPEPTRNLTKKILTGVLVGVVVYGVIVVIGGTKEVGAQLRGFAWQAFVAACGLSCLNYVLRFAKWEYYLAVLGVRGIPKWESLLIYLSGFVLTVTPGKVGEVFKSYVLHERHGVAIERTAPIVVAERLTDLIGVIALITIGGSSFAGGLVWAAIGASVVLGILLLVAVPRLSNALLRFLPRVPLMGKVFARVVPRIEVALVSLRGLTRPKHLIVPTLLSIVGWSLEGVGVYVILKGLGANPSLLQTIFFYGAATLAGALVPVPGGLGITEKVLQESMVRIGGIGHPIATAAMLLGRLATLWFAVAVGFVALGGLRSIPRVPAAEPVGAE